MGKILDLWVPGAPTTKGSMNHIGGGQMVQSVKGSTQWANIIRRAVAARIERGRAGFAERPVPVRVQAVFWVRGEDVVEERAGDVDKLTRNVLDALAADPVKGYRGVYVNDVQVIRCDAVRLVAGMTGMPIGAHITVATYVPDEWSRFGEMVAWNARFAFREVTDPTFQHRSEAVGHDCFMADCGGLE